MVAQYKYAAINWNLPQGSTHKVTDTHTKLLPTAVRHQFHSVFNCQSMYHSWSKNPT